MFSSAITSCLLETVKIWFLVMPQDGPFRAVHIPDLRSALLEVFEEIYQSQSERTLIDRSQESAVYDLRFFKKAKSGASHRSL